MNHKTNIWISILLIGSLFSCGRAVKPEKAVAPVVGYWSEQQNWWVLSADGKFRYGKLKSGTIDAFICGTYEWKDGELVIHDSIGNDLVYGAAIQGDSLVLSSGNGNLSLVRSKPQPVTDRCQTGD